MSGFLPSLSMTTAPKEVPATCTVATMMFSTVLDNCDPADSNICRNGSEWKKLA